MLLGFVPSNESPSAHPDRERLAAVKASVVRLPRTK